MNIQNIKKLYINGDLRILGSKNLYAIWNGWIYAIFINVKFLKEMKKPSFLIAKPKPKYRKPVNRK
jgi:hypothetical protein